ncbi:hypothetical protein ABZ942_32850 [Nocardia sp. NPDC046473]|uniref:hypothetical protein n=1 Tax=Nocardia sp. NPDC046473 TaxID=3155733 RepID=UPI0033DC0BDE
MTGSIHPLDTLSVEKKDSVVAQLLEAGLQADLSAASSGAAKFARPETRSLILGDQLIRSHVVQNTAIELAAELADKVKPPAPTKETPPEPPPLLSNITGGWQIAFSGGIPIGGWASFALYPDGTYNFSGHMHDSGAPAYNCEAAVVIAVAGGNPAFVLPATGRVSGLLGGSRNWNWNTSGSNQAVAEAWPDLSAGHSWHGSATVGVNINATIDQLKTAVGAIGALIVLT